MLHQNAVPPAALELLRKISALPQTESFGLGGRISLALRIGHRLSGDLYFFTNSPFDTSLIFQTVTRNFPAAELLFEKNQTMMFSINDTKVDFVLYPFPWLQPFDIVDEIKLFSINDIIPMKLHAVSNRNAKKDYWDIAALLHHYPLQEMLEIFKTKFPQIDTGFIIHRLTDFEQADTELDPVSYTNITWDEIKLLLTNEVLKYTEGLL